MRRRAHVRAPAVAGASIEHALTVYTDSLDAYANDVDIPDLLDRIDRLSATDKIALVDSIERARIAERAGKRIVVTPP